MIFILDMGYIFLLIVCVYMYVYVCVCVSIFIEYRLLGLSECLIFIEQKTIEVGFVACVCVGFCCCCFVFLWVIINSCFFFVSLLDQT